jgi:hypothetical protein
LRSGPAAKIVRVVNWRRQAGERHESDDRRTADWPGPPESPPQSLLTLDEFLARFAGADVEVIDGTARAGLL